MQGARRENGKGYLWYPRSYTHTYRMDGVERDTGIEDRMQQSPYAYYQYVYGTYDEDAC